MENEKQVKLPDWTWGFHGHRCPVMPIGYRMGVIAIRGLEMERVKDHGAFASPEMGMGHPQTCMMDGIMSATGCTYGKLAMERLDCGTVAMVLYATDKGAVRIHLRSDFQDELGKEESEHA